jgi:hypothetical protein
MQVKTPTDEARRLMNESGGQARLLTAKPRVAPVKSHTGAGGSVVGSKTYKVSSKGVTTSEGQENHFLD